MLSLDEAGEAFGLYAEECKLLREVRASYVNALLFRANCVTVADPEISF